MKEEQDSDRNEAETFLDSLSEKKLTEMSEMDRINVLHGVCFFLLKELQKIYMHLEKHSIAYDTMLHRDLANIFAQTDGVLATFFSDLIQLEQRLEDGIVEEGTDEQSK